MNFFAAAQSSRTEEEKDQTLHKMNVLSIFIVLMAPILNQYQAADKTMPPAPAGWRISLPGLSDWLFLIKIDFHNFDT